MNPLYWEIMNKRSRGFYGNSGGQQIGFTQNGDSTMGRFTGYDQQMRGDNQYDNRYPYIDDDRVRNAQRNGGYSGNGGQQMNGYSGNQQNGYQGNGGRDFQLRKGGN